MYQISQLFIYPIKALSGVAVEQSFVTQRGLRYDRRWMLVDSKNQFITQRNYPQLCLFRVTLNQYHFQVQYNIQSIEIPYEIDAGDITAVQVWNDTVNAIIASSHINEFFSQQLNTACRLVFMPDSSIRHVDHNYVNGTHAVSFADGYPILLIGQESLSMINQKLTEAIDIRRFRPNIVFKGGCAHEEDHWGYFSIESVRMKGVKPCGRCMVVNIDHQSGIVSQEPLSTLSTYRKFNQKINFGQNVIALGEGQIAVGNKIIII
jgi:uncharacterized protein YcbX